VLRKACAAHILAQQDISISTMLLIYIVMTRRAQTLTSANVVLRRVCALLSSVQCIMHTSITAMGFTAGTMFARKLTSTFAAMKLKVVMPSAAQQAFNGSQTFTCSAVMESLAT